MIKLGDSYIVTPTIFPDKTSQVWNIPEKILLTEDTIIWDFESESELIHVLQLAKLSEYTRKDRPHLIMPFMPYSRQDKPISNTTTFARDIFVNVLKPFFFSISSYDIHSKCDGVLSLPVDICIDHAISKANPNVICYPDKGAANREYKTSVRDIVILEKNRDQQTGEILGLKLSDENKMVDLNHKRILIVDDICDGGKTFIEAAKLLKSMGASHVSLYTTHGIYSKGTDILFKNGIDQIFNLTNEVQN